MHCFQAKYAILKANPSQLILNHRLITGVIRGLMGPSQAPRDPIHSEITIISHHKSHIISLFLQNEGSTLQIYNQGQLDALCPKKLCPIQDDRALRGLYFK